jgi:hypothetical protein
MTSKQDSDNKRMNIILFKLIIDIQEKKKRK